MGFVVEEPTGNELIAPGIYEVVIGRARIKTTDNDREYFSIPFIVRNDVEQAYPNYHIFDAIWDFSDTSNQLKYKVNNISPAVGIEKGTTFESIEDWGRCISGKVLTVEIKHGTYNDKPQINIKAYKVTENKVLRHEFKNQNDVPDFMTIADEDDEDLPF